MLCQHGAFPAAERVQVSSSCRVLCTRGCYGRKPGAAEPMTPSLAQCSFQQGPLRAECSGERTLGMCALEHGLC